MTKIYDLVHTLPLDARPDHDPADFWSADRSSDFSRWKSSVAGIKVPESHQTFFAAGRPREGAAERSSIVSPQYRSPWRPIGGMGTHRDCPDDRPADVRRGTREVDDAPNQIVHIARGARLSAVSEDSDIAVQKRLNDEVGHDAAVIGMRTRSTGVEDARRLDREIVLVAIVEEQSLRARFAFIIKQPKADRIDASPIALWLRTNSRVATRLAAGERLQRNEEIAFVVVGAKSR
jgi:hypothetical protein